MKFFQINSEPDGNVLPHIVGWKDKLDYHAVQQGEIHRLPPRTLLYVENHPDTVFADVVDSPFFLVSDMVWKVMREYDRNVTGKEIILLDDFFGVTGTYHMPSLATYDGLSTQQGWKAAPPFFRYSGEKRNYMIGRLDFVESILRRGAKGVRLREIKEEK